MSTLQTRFITLVLCCTLLSACAPAVLIAGASVGGAVLYEQRHFKTILRDQSIAAHIRDRLNADSTLRHRAHIAVAVFNRVVLLVGQAPTPELRQSALRIARSTRYVRRMFNQITLEMPTPATTRTQDTWLTAKVKTALLEKRRLHSSQIKVVTENGTVFLMGLTTPKQAKLATDAARRVHGVLKVVKLFEYTHQN